ncbi:MAG: YebC/PmpR family DNA-binding transcriptional regulator [Christensenellales bacterium]|jgi:YebC/PmpR family DNA-binding regulatory protein
MSGHSKWANIKNKKAKTDAAKGKIFTKIGREIVMAVKQGGGPDPNTNSKLKDVIAKAKANNMPNDNIMRSIKRAAGDDKADNYESVTYEGYGPCGVAVIVEALTDNRNRTASDVRHLFDKYGNGLGSTGCVSWMFERKGVIVIERTASLDEDEVMMTALDAGAEDFNAEDDAFEITTAPEDFSVVREALEAAGYEFISAEIDMVPQNTVSITSDEDVMKVQRLLDNLEDNDDVQNVYHNADLPEEEEED